MKASILALSGVVAVAAASYACAKYDPEATSGNAAGNAGGASTALVTSLVSAAPPPASSRRPAPAPAAPAASSGPLASIVHPALLDPSKAGDKAPDVFRAKLTTSKGDVVIEVHRDWSPNGADRFYDLVKLGFYDDTRFFRVVDGFMVQFGISGDPAVSSRWQRAGIPDDPVKQSNERGFVSYAQTSAPNSRGTQVFIDTADNARLDAMRFAPFGRVVKGMDVVESLYKGYGDGAPMGSGPDQSLIQTQGNAYLDARFPKLDRILRAGIEK